MVESHWKFWVLAVSLLALGGAAWAVVGGVQVNPDLYKAESPVLGKSLETKKSGDAPLVEKDVLGTKVMVPDVLVVNPFAAGMPTEIRYYFPSGRWTLYSEVYDFQFSEGTEICPDNLNNALWFYFDQVGKQWKEQGTGLAENRQAYPIFIFNEGQDCDLRYPTVEPWPFSIFREAAAEYAPRYINLTPGWNYVPTLWQMVGKPFDQFSNCNVTAAYVFNNNTGQWDEVSLTMGPTGAQTAFGMAVRVTNNCTMNGIPAMPAPPGG